MSTDRSIPTDERFVRWLLDRISRTQKGSISLGIEQGKLRSIACYGHRFIYSAEELEEPPNG